MIPASLLLILVAVTLLVLGLTGGSSNLLISSIVASLLAAVALVVGARQAAGTRRVAEEQIPPTEPGPEPEFLAEPEFAAEAQFATGRRDDPMSRRDTVQFDSAGVAGQGDLSADEARVQGWRDAEEGLADSGPRHPAEAPRHPAETPRHPAEAAAGPHEPEPDYDRASDAINAARSANPGADAWRREPEVTVPAAAAATAATAGGAAAEPDAEEFDEPDADDPDDEPLPQSVRPADAVRVARMDAEVLVVDGRPRYHLADCPHLMGKLTEPIPVNEAIELGFTPCGLCRPVDRLAAAAARR